ncbi:MAG: tetratricopeptide repeat protein, partial [Prevotella sp.]|nr:tetratricopeptide repeat protein [Prevotella sp.]
MRKLFILPLLFFLLLIGCGEGRTDYMRALLHEQDSLNRAYKHLSLDTIRQLTDYFDHHGTNYDRMHAHYLLGSVYRDMGEAPASLAAFQHAIEVADTTAGGDSIYALLAKVHGQMGTILIKQYLPNEAAKEFRLASRYSLMNNDTIDALQRKLGVLH